MRHGSVFTVFSTRTNFNKCLWHRYNHIVRNTRTDFTIKTRDFLNISTIFRFLGVSFAAMNATKYLFCCVRYCKQFVLVKICTHNMDSLYPGFLCRPALLSGSGCCRIAPGAGVCGIRPGRGLVPQPPKSEKSPLPSPKSRKNKKGDFQFYKSSLRSLHKYIFNPPLTYRYVYGIFKAHRRCYQCKSIKQLGK